MYYGNTPRCSSLCVFVDLSQSCIHSATNPHVFMLWGADVDSVSLVTIKEWPLGTFRYILDGFIILYPKWNVGS